MQVNHFLEISAQKYPAKPAVWYQNRWQTYGEIDLLTNKLGNYLKDCKIGKGDRVALMLENSFDYIIGYYAVLKIGAIAVPLNTENTAESLAYFLNDSGAVSLLTKTRYLKQVIPALEKSFHLRTLITDKEILPDPVNNRRFNHTYFREIFEHGKDAYPGIRSIDVDIASIIYTSGSTGKPKGVTLTHLNIVSNTRSIVQYLSLSPHDRIMVVLPFYYIYGKSLLNTHFSVGGSVVLDNRFAYPNVILETMKNAEVTGFSGVPSTYMILLNRSVVRKYKFDSLRYVTQAGGAMAVKIQKEVANVFSPAKLFVMYGATEASARLSYLDPNVLTAKWGSIGKAVPNVNLFVADAKGNRLPSGEIGEIVARGSNIMIGYWNDPDETAGVLKNGLYFTGDLGRMDEDGYLYVAGRIKDMIKVGGERISAKEVEEAISEINGVHEVAVIGMEDETLGETMKAFIVPREMSNGVNENVVQTALRKKLPLYKIPKHYSFCENLPRNESGKILKNVLKEQEENL